MFNYFLMLIGAPLSFAGYYWAFHQKLNPDYYVSFGRSEKTQNILQILMGILYPGFYLLIIFSFGLDVKRIIINFIVVLILNNALFPMIIGYIKGNAITQKEVEKVYSNKKS